MPSLVTTPFRAPSCVSTCAIKLSLPVASTRAIVSRASLAAPTYRKIAFYLQTSQVADIPVDGFGVIFLPFVLRTISC